jgi:hypothetical protein
MMCGWSQTLCQHIVGCAEAPALEQRAVSFLVLGTNQLHDLWDPEVQYHIKKASPIISILSPINPIALLTSIYLI